MGRRTYESIGRALPDRRNIILSRDPEFRAIGCETYTSYQCVLQSISKEIEVMVIGGASIYSQFLPVADRLFLTSVDTISGADVFFPKIDYSTWQQVDSEYVPADSKNIHDCTFEVFKKRK
jgi:dihydrofolate reductase